MKNVLRCLVTAAVLMAVLPSFDRQRADGQTPAAGQARIMSTLFPTEDVVVASFDVTDTPYNADLTGERDVTAALQQAIDDCYESGGGVVWLPAGTYRITGSIHVRNHVTLRGDWRDPDSGSGSYGTLMVADVPSGNEADPGLFRIWGSAGVKGLTVYYPRQNIDDVVPYPYTFEILGSSLGQDGLMSASIQNVTLLNAYQGISAGKDAPHELHFIQHVRGTVLKNALNLQDTSDVGRVQSVRFNNSYWAAIDPSLHATPPNRAKIDAWTQQHGTGLMIGGVEWDQMNDLSFSDYHTGIDIIAGRRISTAATIAGLEILHSQIGLNANFLDQRAGLMIAGAVIQADIGSEAVAIQAGENVGGSVLINHAVLSGGQTVLNLSGNTFVGLHNVTIERWAGPFGIVAQAGTLSVQDVTFVPALTGEHQAIQLGPDVLSAVIIGNHFTGNADDLLENNSTGDVYRDDAPVDFSRMEFPVLDPQDAVPPLPAPALTNVRQPPFNAQGDGHTDDTGAIQSALDLAGEQGGGIVYLPAGLYAVYGHLTVPPGVELRGADDVPHRAAVYGPSSGTVLLSYMPPTSGDTDDADPLIKLIGPHAGVRGLSFHYPGQRTTGVEDIQPYPWTIVGDGDSVYAVNLAFSNVYQGIDFASHATSHHLIDQVVGTVLKEGVWVGHSEAGRVQNTHFNITGWVRANGLPNRLDDTFQFSVAGEFTRRNLNAFVIADGSQNEGLLNNFVYSAHVGFQIDGISNAWLVNNAADGSEDIFVVHNTGPGGIEIVNAEGCCRGGAMARVENGWARLYNVVAIERVRPALDSTGGSTVVQGGSFQLGTVTVTGGRLQMNGVLFKVNRPHVVVSGPHASVVIVGNIGSGSEFRLEAEKGADVIQRGNVRW